MQADTHSSVNMAASNGALRGPSTRPPPSTGLPAVRHIGQVKYAAQSSDFLERIKDILDVADVEQPLTRENYREKFHKLLCWEEKRHIEILKER